MARPRLDIDEQAVVSAYEGGASILGLATELGVDRYVIRRVLTDHDVPVGGRTNVLTLPSNHLDDLPEGYITGPDLAIRAGITYRQLDYWCRTGYLHPLRATPGSGHARLLPIADVGLARLVKILLEAGLLPRQAFALAEQLLEHGHAHLAGIRIDLPQDL